MFIEIKCCCLAGSPGWHNAVDAIVDLKINQLTKSIFIDSTVLKRCNDRGVGASKHGEVNLVNINRTFESEIGRPFKSDLFEPGVGSSEAHFQPIPAPYQNVNWRFQIVQRRVNES